MKKETIRITGMGSEMQGVGRLTDGRAAFVPGALPDEEVEIAVTREASRFCEARMERVIATSAHRIAPACPYFAICGGCPALHMDYAYSLEMKRQRVFDALARIGGVDQPNVRAAIGDDQPFHYRNKAEYAVSMGADGLRIGCTAARSNRIIPIEDCLLQHPASLKVMRWMREHLPEYACANHVRNLVTRVNQRNEMSVTLSGDAPIERDLAGLAERLSADVPEVRSLHYCRLRARPAHALDGVCRKIRGREVLHDTLLGLDFALSPQSFFQINPHQTEKLYACALDVIGENKRVLDVYCGAGTITLSAAKRGCRATGVEIVPPAIENAKKNAAANHLENAAGFICGDAAIEIPRLIANGKRFDAVILDPPRKGADARVLNAIASSGVSQIAYVSCNPSTLARDVKILAADGYRLEWAKPVDMFPWTEHVETIVLLQRETL